jgi:hypothetical protein
MLSSPAVYSQQYSARYVLVLQDPELESPWEYGCGVPCHSTAFTAVLVGAVCVHEAVFARTV